MLTKVEKEKLEKRNKEIEDIIQSINLEWFPTKEQYLEIVEEQNNIQALLMTETEEENLLEI